MDKKSIQWGLVLLLALSSPRVIAQADSSWQATPQVRIGGFIEVFYAFDFNQPEGSSRQPYLFNHNRHNEVNLNSGIIQMALEHPKYRANLALQAGTYAMDNYAAEPPMLQHIYEANAGFALNKKNTLWIDAGIFESFIGFESVMSLDNLTLTRSLAAENSPYYMTGARLSYDVKKWHISAWVLNGWQRIQREEGSVYPSVGTQVQFRPSEALTLNLSSFAGTDHPDITIAYRIFNNLYADWKISRRIRVIGGFDYGIQQNPGIGGSFRWYAPVLIAQYALSEKWKTAVRAEHYNDLQGVIVTHVEGAGFRSTGISWNVDYTPHPSIACRMEARTIGTDNNLWQNMFVAASIAVKLDHVLKTE